MLPNPKDLLDEIFNSLILLCESLGSAQRFLAVDAPACATETKSGLQVGPYIAPSMMLGCNFTPVTYYPIVEEIQDQDHQDVQ